MIHGGESTNPADVNDSLELEGRVLLLLLVEFNGPLLALEIPSHSNITSFAS